MPLQEIELIKSIPCYCHSLVAKPGQRRLLSSVYITRKQSSFQSQASQPLKESSPLHPFPMTLRQFWKPTALFGHLLIAEDSGFHSPSTIDLLFSNCSLTRALHSFCLIFFCWVFHNLLVQRYCSLNNFYWRLHKLYTAVQHQYFSSMRFWNAISLWIILLLLLPSKKHTWCEMTNSLMKLCTDI